ncbi:MAG: protein kinase [Candidatus Sumerlaeia bacterium]|nr:protein kinase [Candidatus Sumerlaeia bacterium]
MNFELIESIPDDCSSLRTISFKGDRMVLAEKGEIPGTMGLDGYSLLSILGMGGVGEVHRGVQHALGRLVAIKKLRADRLEEISRDPDSLREELLEFRMEAAISASLEHPGIMPVYDLAYDSQGNPMLAMKLMGGRNWQDVLLRDLDEMPWGEYLTKHIGILIQLSQAVAYAHSRGILHRDLKPAQVVLGEFGEALLTDWGMAVIHDKALVPESLRQSFLGDLLPLAQGVNSPAGTPAYMAPEQADPSLGKVGTHTDIFLLGSILYEILTGNPPHKSVNAKKALYAAAKGEVEPPSKKKKFGPAITPELERITLTAMAFKPEQRYETVGHFVSALEEYVRGVNRQRESRQLVELAKERLRVERPSYGDFQESLNHLIRAKSLHVEGPFQEELLEQTTRDFARSALANGDLILARLQAGNLQKGEQQEELFSEIHHAEDRVRRQKQQRRVAIRLAVVLGAFTLLGGLEYFRAQRVSQLALEAQVRDTIKARNEAESALTFMIGDLRESLEPVGKIRVLDNLGERAVLYFEELPEVSKTPETKLKHAVALGQIGKVRQVQGRLEDALEDYRRARVLLEELDHSPALTEHLNREQMLEWAENSLRQSEVLMFQGKLAEAGTLIQEALARLSSAVNGKPPLRETIVLAQLETEWGRIAEAEGNLQLAQEHHQRSTELLATQPEDLSGLLRRDWKQTKARAHAALGRTLRTKGQITQAKQQLTISFDLLTNLATEEQSDAQVKVLRAACARMLAGIHESEGNLLKSLELYEESSNLLRILVKGEPTNAQWLDDFSVSLIGEGRVARTLGESMSTFHLYQEAMEIRRDLALLDPTNSTWQRDYSLSLRTLGLAQEALGKVEEALVSFEESLRIIEPIAAEHPNKLQWSWDHSSSLYHIGRMHQALGNSTEARTYLEQGNAIRRDVVGRSSTNTIFLRDLFNSEQYLAEAYLDWGKTSEAEELIDRCLKGLAEGAWGTEASHEWKRTESLLHYSKAKCLTKKENWDSAMQECDLAIRISRKLLSEGATNLLINQDLADSLKLKMLIFQAQGRDSEAEFLMREVVQLWELMCRIDPEQHLWAIEKAVNTMILSHNLKSTKPGESAELLDKAKKLVEELNLRESPLLEGRCYFVYGLIVGREAEESDRLLAKKILQTSNKEYEYVQAYRKLWDVTFGPIE